MTTKHFTAGFIFGMSMSVISWIVAMIVSSGLRKTEYYGKLSNLNFIKSKAVNKRIGINYFKWIVKNTPFKFFNQSIKLEGRKVDLSDLRNEMTLSEINHLIGFVLVTIVAIYQSFNVGLVFGLTMMIPNLLLNMYPSLLQQENKRRIDKLIKRRKM